MIAPLLFLAGAAASLGALYYLGREFLFADEEDVEPAAPVPLPELPPTAKPGSSGISINDQEVEALARGIRSEAGDGPPAERRAVAWAIRNMFRGKSIYDVAHPWRAQRGRNPPFSSARAASAEDRKLAREVLLADQADDPTGGATSFFEPRMQDAFRYFGELARAGRTGPVVYRDAVGEVSTRDVAKFVHYKRDAAGIREKWGKGSTLYARAGRFEFWGSAPLFARRGGVVRDIVTGEEPPPASRGGALVEPGAAGDLEAAARVVASEFPKSPEEGRLAAWAIRNLAARTGKTVSEILAPWGAYGPRETSGGYASTRSPATPEALAVAADALSAPQDRDPTGGAIGFWCPALQDQFLALGDLARRARAAGDEKKTQRYGRFEAFDEGADEVRARHEAAGLRVSRREGGVELLAPVDRKRRI